MLGKVNMAREVLHLFSVSWPLDYSKPFAQARKTAGLLKTLKPCLEHDSRLYAYPELSTGPELDDVGSRRNTKFDIAPASILKWTSKSIARRGFLA
jgi:hypothetical protein